MNEPKYKIGQKVIVTSKGAPAGTGEYYGHAHNYVKLGDILTVKRISGDSKARVYWFDEKLAGASGLYESEINEVGHSFEF